jgi:hypothetical protein
LFPLAHSADWWRSAQFLATQLQAECDWRATAHLAVNVAGHRESSTPGFGLIVEEYLCLAFTAMGFPEISDV